jgi:hypothetical protein
MFNWFTALFALSMAFFGVQLLIDPARFNLTAPNPQLLRRRKILLAILCFATSGISVAMAFTDPLAPDRLTPARGGMIIMSCGFGVLAIAGWAHVGIQIAQLVRTRGHTNRTEILPN